MKLSLCINCLIGLSLEFFSRNFRRERKEQKKEKYFIHLIRNSIVRANCATFCTGVKIMSIFSCDAHKGRFVCSAFSCLLCSNWRKIFFEVFLIFFKLINLDEQSLYFLSLTRHKFTHLEPVHHQFSSTKWSISKRGTNKTKIYPMKYRDIHTKTSNGRILYLYCIAWSLRYIMLKFILFRFFFHFQVNFYLVKEMITS